VIKFSFTYKDSVQTKPNYFNNGLNYYQVSAFDIVKIEPVNPQPKQRSLNTLDSKTLDTIATALTPGVINYIESQEKYAEVMQNLIMEYVEKNLGNVNVELPFMIFDMIILNTSQQTKTLEQLAHGSHTTSNPSTRLTGSATNKLK
jgi:hypothetical protein